MWMLPKATPLITLIAGTFGKKLFLRNPTRINNGKEADTFGKEHRCQLLIPWELRFWLMRACVRACMHA